MANDRNEKPAGSFHLPGPVRDTLLFVGQWLLVTAGIFVWWMGLQLALSLFAVNVWHVTLRQIAVRSALLTAACSAGYLIVMVRREEKKRR